LRQYPIAKQGLCGAFGKNNPLPDHDFNIVSKPLIVISGPSRRQRNHPAGGRNASCRSILSSPPPPARAAKMKSTAGIISLYPRTNLRA
jgi:hypothetical protein